jgi:hypothetical protein
LCSTGVVVQFYNRPSNHPFEMAVTATISSGGQQP